MEPLGPLFVDRKVGNSVSGPPPRSRRSRESRLASSWAAQTALRPLLIHKGRMAKPSLRMRDGLHERNTAKRYISLARASTAEAQAGCADRPSHPPLQKFESMLPYVPMHGRIRAEQQRTMLHHRPASKTSRPPTVQQSAEQPPGSSRHESRDSAFERYCIEALCQPAAAPLQELQNSDRVRTRQRRRSV